MRNRPLCFVLVSLMSAALSVRAQDVFRSTSADGDQLPEAEPVVVSATRFDIPLDQSPASVSVIDTQDMDNKQIERVADALRAVPGLSVVQTGTPGQLTSVFMRGLPSQDMQVLLDGIPINQGLAGQFDFANLTTDNIDRIEVARGPQSTIYGPRALAGVVQIFTKQGNGTPGVTLTEEGGTYDTFRETLASDGKIDVFDYSIGASRLDTDNARPNNQYRNTAEIADLGLSLTDNLRVGALITYSLSDTGNPNTIFNPKPFDNFLTEKWLIGPHVDWKATDWWEHIVPPDAARLPKRFAADVVAYTDQRILFQSRGSGTGAAVCVASVRAAADFYQRPNDGNCWLFRGDVDADSQSDLRRRWTNRSFQSVWRRLDLSCREQLQDRQDGHDAARQRRHGI